MSKDYKKLINLLENILNKDPTMLNTATAYVNQFLINLFPNTYKYEIGDELVFDNIAQNAMGNDVILEKTYYNKSIFINKIIKRYI
jgi:hypothetical protein